RYCTNLAAKHAKLVQLMQKFRPRCLVRIFCNERSRSTLLDPKLMFWCVSFRSGAFWTVSLLHETWCKSAKLVQLMQKFVQRCLVRIFCKERSRSTPFDPKLMFGCVSLRSGAFWNSFATARKSVQIGQPGAISAIVYATTSRQNFSKPTLPIHTIDPKLMFSCVS